jgi:hypothetical protein
MALSMSHDSRAVSNPTRQTLFMWLAACSFALLAQTTEASTHDLEYRVKAAFLFNFTRFVDWPPDAYASTESPLEICIIGNDPFGQNLDEAMAGKLVDRHPLKARRIRQPSEAETCEILFVSTSEQARQRELISALNGHPILTVGETPDFIQDGGMVRFLLVDGKIRFIINQRMVELAKLTVSSKLLSVAHSVVRDTGNQAAP